MVVKKIALLSSILVGMSLFSACSNGEGNSIAQESKVNIGISQIASHPALDLAREGFIEALNSNGFKEGENLNLEIQNSEGDISTSQMIAQSFTSSNKDLIFAIGTPAAQAAFNTTNNIPIITTAVTDAVQAGLVKSKDKSGTNVAGTSDAVPLEKQLKLIKELVKDVKTIGVIFNTSEVNSEIQVNELKELAKKNNIEVIAKGVSSVSDISQTLDSILGDIDVLYTPADNLVASSMAIITNKAIEKKVPIMGAEEAHVKGGALITEGINYKKLGFEAGLMAIEVLKGKDISELSIKSLEDTELVINEDTLKSLSINIDDEIMSRAKLIKGGE
ncbi:ABC transporter substrate-binding protein [Clostridium paraputrificum]|uniref:ABC transporter substrate-binding protein n=1 Tax=Clostridium TaxID=1485 RepID=UPI003D32554E